MKQELMETQTSGRGTRPEKHANIYLSLLPSFAAPANFFRCAFHSCWRAFFNPLTVPVQVCEVGFCMGAGIVFIFLFRYYFFEKELI